MKNLTIEQQDKLGKIIAEIFNIKKNKQNRYITSWGDKTPFGLVETLLRIAADINDNKEIKS